MAGRFSCQTMRPEPVSSPANSDSQQPPSGPATTATRTPIDCPPTLGRSSPSPTRPVSGGPHAGPAGGMPPDLPFMILKDRPAIRTTILQDHGEVGRTDHRE